MELPDVNEMLEDSCWVKAMQEELDQFQKNDIWKLIKLPLGKHVVGAKWVFRNKLNVYGKVVRNKARLIAKDYSQ